jgi:O-antigen ligase
MEECLSGKRELSLQARISVPGFGRHNLMSYGMSGLSLLVAITAGWAIGSSAVNSLLLMAVPAIAVLVMKPWLGLPVLLVIGAFGKLGEPYDFPIDVMQAAGFVTICSALLFFMKNRLGYRPSPLDGPLLLLVVALIATLPGSDLDTYLPQVLSFLTLFVLYGVSVQLLDTQYKIYVTLSIFVTTSAVIVVACIVFLIARKPELSLAGRSVLLFYSNKYGNTRVSGPFEQPNVFAQLTAIAVPVGLALTFSTKGLKRGLLGVMTGLNAAGTLLTQSRSAFLGIIIGVALLIYLTEQIKRPRHYVTLALVSLASIISLSITGLGEKVFERLKPETTIIETEDAERHVGRTLTFPVAVEIFLERPWGAGYGQAKHLIGEELGVDARSAHNILLSWTVEFGILGLVVAIWLMFRQVRMLSQVTRHPLNAEWRMLGAGCLGAVMATWIHNMVHATLHSGLVWLFFAIASSVAMLGRQDQGTITSRKPLYKLFQN